MNLWPNGLRGKAGFTHTAGELGLVRVGGAGKAAQVRDHTLREREKEKNGGFRLLHVTVGGPQRWIKCESHEQSTIRKKGGRGWNHRTPRENGQWAAQGGGGEATRHARHMLITAASGRHCPPARRTRETVLLAASM